MPSPLASSLIPERRNISKTRFRMSRKEGTTLARSAYQRVIDQASGSYEAKEAAKGIKRLDDPARREANKKAMEAQAQAQLAREREKEEASLRRKIEQISGWATHLRE